MTSKEALEGLIDAYISWRAFQTRECIENDYRYQKVLKDLDRLERLEKEYQDLKEWCLILNRHLYIAPEVCELRMATPKNADFLIKNGWWVKYYNGIDVHEIYYKKFVDLYYSKIKEVLENE